MKFRFTVIVSLLYCSLFLTISDAKTINAVYSDERSLAPIRDKVITEGWLPQEALKTKEQVCSSIQQQLLNVNTDQNFLESRIVFNHHQRLYFYDAPNDICLRSDGVFIVDNDKVQASDKSSTAGFTYVRFVHPVTKDVTSGWVQSSGLARPQQ